MLRTLVRVSDICDVNVHEERKLAFRSARLGLHLLIGQWRSLSIVNPIANR